MNGMIKQQQININNIQAHQIIKRQQKNNKQISKESIIQFERLCFQKQVKIFSDYRLSIKKSKKQKLFKINQSQPIANSKKINQNKSNSSSNLMPTISTNYSQKEILRYFTGVVSIRTILFYTEQDFKRKNATFICLNYFSKLDQNDIVSIKCRLYDQISKYKNEYPNHMTSIQKYQSINPFQKKQGDDQKFIELLFSQNPISDFLFKQIKYIIDPTYIQQIPIYLSYNIIRQKYKNLEKLDRFFLVIRLTNEQQQLLRQKYQQNKYFIFTTFTKGYTNQQDAINYIKQIRGDQNIKQTDIFKVQVYIKQKDVKQSQYDFGYYYDKKRIGQNLILNINHVFMIKKYYHDKHIIEIQYQTLPKLINNVKDKKKRANMKPIQFKIITNFNFLENQCRKMELSQMFFRFGLFQFAQIIAIQKIDIQKMRNSINNNSSCLEKIDKSKIQLANIYSSMRKHQKAQEIYRSIQSSFIQKARIYLAASILNMCYSSIKAQQKQLHKNRFIDTVNNINMKQIKQIINQNSISLQIQGLYGILFKILAILLQDKIAKQEFNKIDIQINDIRKVIIKYPKLGRIESFRLFNDSLTVLSFKFLKQNNYAEAVSLLETLIQNIEKCDLNQSLIYARKSFLQVSERKYEYQSKEVMSQDKRKKLNQQYKQKNQKIKLFIKRYQPYAENFNINLLSIRISFL